MGSTWGIKKEKLIKWHQELRSAAAARARAWAASPALSASNSVARPSVSPSSESPSLLSADSQEEVASRESPPTSTSRPAPSSDPSSRTLSATPLSTPNTQEKDRHRSRRCLRSQETGQNPLRLRRLNILRPVYCPGRFHHQPLSLIQ